MGAAARGPPVHLKLSSVQTVRSTGLSSTLLCLWWQIMFYLQQQVHYHLPSSSRELFSSQFPFNNKSCRKKTCISFVFEPQCWFAISNSSSFAFHIQQSARYSPNKDRVQVVHQLESTNFVSDTIIPASNWRRYKCSLASTANTVQSIISAKLYSRNKKKYD